MSYKKFTKDVGILGLAQFTSVLSGIILLPIITKLLGVENYGIWIQILVTIGLITPAVLLGLPFALVRFLPGEKDKKEIQDGVWSVFVVILGASAIVSLLLILFSNPVSKFLGFNQIFIFILSAIIIFECLNQLFSSIFRAFQLIKECSILGIIQKLSEVGLVILAIFLDFGLLGAVLSLLIIRIIMFVIMGTFIIKIVGIKIPKFIKIKEHLRFSLPLLPADISNWIIQSSDKYFIGFFFGTLFVGYYSPAYTLGCFLSFFTSPLGFLLPATLSKYHDENEMEKVKSYLKYSLKYFLLIAIPAVFGLSVLSKPLLSTFSTPDIAQHSYFITPIIALSMLLLGMYAMANQALSLKKQTHISGAIWVIAAFLNFGLNFMTVPLLGILGAAITTLISCAFIFIATYYYSFKNFRFQIDWTFILKSIFASTLMSFIILPINPLGLWKILGTVSFGGAVYFIFIFLFNGFEKKEIAIFKSLFKN